MPGRAKSNTKKTQIEREAHNVLMKRAVKAYQAEQMKIYPVSHAKSVWLVAIHTYNRLYCMMRIIDQYLSIFFFYFLATQTRFPYLVIL